MLHTIKSKHIKTNIKIYLNPLVEVPKVSFATIFLDLLFLLLRTILICFAHSFYYCIALTQHRTALSPATPLHTYQNVCLLFKLT